MLFDERYKGRTAVAVYGYGAISAELNVPWYIINIPSVDERTKADLIPRR
jgi:hypothetical protein